MEWQIYIINHAPKFIIHLFSTQFILFLSPLPLNDETDQIFRTKTQVKCPIMLLFRTKTQVKCPIMFVIQNQNTGEMSNYVCCLQVKGYIALAMHFTSITED